MVNCVACVEERELAVNLCSELCNSLVLQLVKQEEVAESKDSDADCWDVLAVRQFWDVDVCLHIQTLREMFSDRKVSISGLTLGVDEAKQDVDEIRVLLFQHNLARHSLLPHFASALQAKDCLGSRAP